MQVGEMYHLIFRVGTSLLIDCVYVGAVLVCSWDGMLCLKFRRICYVTFGMIALLYLKKSNILAGFNVTNEIR